MKHSQYINDKILFLLKYQWQNFISTKDKNKNLINVNYDTNKNKLIIKWTKKNIKIENKITKIKQNKILSTFTDKLKQNKLDINELWDLNNNDNGFYLHKIIDKSIQHPKIKKIINRYKNRLLWIPNINELILNYVVPDDVVLYRIQDKNYIGKAKEYADWEFMLRFSVWDSAMAEQYNKDNNNKILTKTTLWKIRNTLWWWCTLDQRRLGALEYVLPKEKSGIYNKDIYEIIPPTHQQTSIKVKKNPAIKAKNNNITSTDRSNLNKIYKLCDIPFFWEENYFSNIEDIKNLKLTEDEISLIENFVSLTGAKFKNIHEIHNILDHEEMTKEIINTAKIIKTITKKNISKNDILNIANYKITEKDIKNTEKIFNIIWKNQDFNINDINKIKIWNITDEDAKLTLKLANTIWITNIDIDDIDDVKIFKITEENINNINILIKNEIDFSDKKKLSSFDISQYKLFTTKNIKNIINIQKHINNWNSNIKLNVYDCFHIIWTLTTDNFNIDKIELPKTSLVGTLNNYSKSVIAEFYIQNHFNDQIISEIKKHWPLYDNEIIMEMHISTNKWNWNITEILTEVKNGLINMQKYLLNAEKQWLTMPKYIIWLSHLSFVAKRYWFNIYDVDENTAKNSFVFRKKLSLKAKNIFFTERNDIINNVISDLYWNYTYFNDKRMSQKYSANDIKLAMISTKNFLNINFQESQTIKPIILQKQEKLELSEEEFQDWDEIIISNWEKKYIFQKLEWIDKFAIYDKV